jgi:ATP phosphoribosyltransferase
VLTRIRSTIGPFPGPNGRQLWARQGDTHLLFARGWDIPFLVASGIADYGVTGLDVVEETAPSLRRVAPLDCRASKVVLASPRNADSSRIGFRPVITEYPSLTRTHFQRQGLAPLLIPVRGAAEVGAGASSPLEVVTLLTAGKTLEENGLEVKAELLESDAVIVARDSSHDVETFWDELAAFSAAQAR